MSAGLSSTEVAVSRDLSLLAPKFRDAVAAAVAECSARGLDPFVYETYRSPELQALYYARGRTVIPPQQPVTNARSNLYSWHGYGLAVDVISQSAGWDAPLSWFGEVAHVFRRYGCKWGGDWTYPDPPHFQWGLCKPSPSGRARDLMAREGVAGVWVAVGAV